MYKRFKKSTPVLLITFCLLALFGPVALAAETVNPGLLNQINQTDYYVQNEIDKAVAKAEKESLKNQSEEELNYAIDKIVNELLEKTSKRVDKVFQKAAGEEIELTKEYIEVQILDRVVYVDPLYVH